jgi:serine/threonine protein kinase
LGANNITIGVARGLEYLHGQGNANILHLNVKPCNVLLDQELWPKMSDVGVANLCHGKDSKRPTGDAGERDGYDAPEIVSRKFGAVSSKSDVYSYGIMILEMVRAKRSTNKLEHDTTSSDHLTATARHHLKRQPHAHTTPGNNSKYTKQPTGDRVPTEIQRQQQAASRGNWLQTGRRSLAPDLSPDTTGRPQSSCPPGS